MLKKTISYTDFDGNRRTEDFYFNLTESEIADMEMSINGRFSTKLRRLISSQNTSEIVSIFKDLILKSYGEKSDDGKHFRKSPAISEDFQNTNAYDTLYMSMVSDVNEAIAFVKGIIPPSLAEKVNTKDLEKAETLEEVANAIK